MKRALLISFALILTLTLLPTTLIAAIKPRPEEQAQVTVNGDIENGALTLDVYRYGKLVVVTGPADFTFKETLGEGTWSDGSIPYGTIDVDDEAFTIYQMIYTSGSKKNGKGATSVTYEEVGGGSVSFNITIE